MSIQNRFVSPLDTTRKYWDSTMIEEKNQVIADLPIILLHGLGSHPVTMKGIEYYLNCRGMWHTHNLTYKSSTLTLEESVDNIYKQLVSLNMTGRDIIIIGQSMGGVIGSKLVSFDDIHVKLLITIGSPLKGARALEKLPTVLTRSSLMYKPMYDDLLYMLTETQVAPACKYHCITMSWPFTTFDGCVFMDEGYFDEDFHTHLNWADHRTVFGNPRLWTHVHTVICCHEHLSVTIE